MTLKITGNLQNFWPPTRSLKNCQIRFGHPKSCLKIVENQSENCCALQLMLQLLYAASFEKSPTISGLFFSFSTLKEQQPLQVKCNSNSLQLASSPLSPHPFFHCCTIVETKNKGMLSWPSFFSKKDQNVKKLISEGK